MSRWAGTALLLVALVLCGCRANAPEANAGLPTAPGRVICKAGFYCPSATHTSVPCGLTTRHYCPANQVHPLPTALGYYARDFVKPSYTSSTQAADLGSGMVHAVADELGGFAAQAVCPLGSYCIEGMRHACPAGRFGNVVGIVNASCSGMCTEGFYCPEGSTSSRQHPCGSAAFYCPRGSAGPKRVSVSHFTYGHQEGKVADVHEISLSNTELAPATRFCLSVSARTACAAPGGLSVTSSAAEIKAYIQALQANLVTVSTPVLSNVGTFSFRVTFSGYNRPVDLIAAQRDSAAPMATLARVERLSSSTDPLLGEEFHGLHHTSQALCEPGYWCEENTGTRKNCPRGRYGASAGLSSSHCDGPCSEGYFCLEGSTSVRQFECGSVDKFCPLGSFAPQTVHDGYYTLGSSLDEATRSSEMKCEPGSWCSGGVRRLCSLGHWGNEYGATQATCSGICRAGYVCPEGSSSDEALMCGDPDKYCPLGSLQPHRVSLGYYSIGGTESTRTDQLIAPRGHFAVSGLLFPCRAGYFGSSEGLSTPSCSGPCVAGFYCPTGSTSPFMHHCGSDSLYCPPRAVAPIQVDPGFYTADYLLDACPPGKYRNASMTWVDASLSSTTIPLSHSSSIVTEAHKPDCILCPSGKFKSVSGDDSSLCRRCDSNLRYPRVVSADDRMTCICLEVTAPGTFTHFNITTGKCTNFTSSSAPLLADVGWQYNVSISRSFQKECEPGHFCLLGLRYKCPVGFYGALTRETRPRCQGLCAQGYYCQLASISPFATPCGAVNYICPNGSSLPQVVPSGFYTVGDVPETLRFQKAICPPGSFCPGDGRVYLCPQGTYASEVGASSATCSGLCNRGYYCPAGSTSPQQIECGDASVYCPIGSSAPTPVHDGFYSIFTGLDSGAQALWDKRNATASAELPCEPGYYCAAGIKYPCPPGTFGWRYGDTTSKCGGLCAAGYYCPSYLTPQPGAPPNTQWPGRPHTKAAELICGGVTFYCPRGTIFPLKVGAGNYTVGGDATNTTRTGQQVCLPGTFCENGIVHLCPKGRYGDQSGAAVKTCSGWCPPGFYCPAGTSNPLPCEGQSYSVGSSWACSECPGIRTTPLLCKTSRACCFRG